MRAVLTRPESKTVDPVNSKILMVINADTRKQSNPSPDRTRERLADYTALKNILQAEVLDWNSLAGKRWTRWLAKLAGKNATLAALAFTRCRRYEVLYCDGENDGLPLALLLKFSRVRKPLIMIGHWLTPPKKALLFKRLKLHRQISRLLVHSSTQHEKAIKDLDIPPEKLQLIPYQVDTEFWRVENVRPEALPGPGDRPYICTAGLEFRDYPTLIEAVRGLDLDLKIGAASHWSKRKNSALEVALPDNVSVKSYNYHQLRDLYAGSRFVVVPLYDVDFQAGITLILEAMSMGKAVIVTRSEGQGDTIVDSRLTTRSGPPRLTRGYFTRLLDNGEHKLEGYTGFYVSTGNVYELRQTIKYLLENPARAEEMGQEARRTVESLMTVELFAERISRVIEEVLAAQA